MDNFKYETDNNEEKNKIAILSYENENIYKYYIIDTEKDKIISTINVSKDFFVAKIETIKRIHFNNGNIIDIPVDKNDI